MLDEFYNLTQKKVGNKTEPNWRIKLKLDIIGNRGETAEFHM